MKRFKFLAVGAALLAAVGLAHAAGYFPNFPIVGGSAYNAGSGVTVPAGPSALTGNELFPADTALSGGRSPQTVLVPVAALNALPMEYTSVTTGAASGSITAANTSGCVIFTNSTATITPWTVQFPAGAIDNQTFCIAAVASLSSLTVTPNTSQSILGTLPNGLTPSTTTTNGYKWVFRASNSSWYRLR